MVNTSLAPRGDRAFVCFVALWLPPVPVDVLLSPAHVIHGDANTYHGYSVKHNTTHISQALLSASTVILVGADHALCMRAA
jgi:hypothetical protein